MMKYSPILLPLCAVSLLLLVVGSQAQDFDFQKMMNQSCPNFKCSSGYTPVPKSRQKFESTGCSAMGGGSVMMNPGDSAANEKPYENCCHAWHACYQVCGVSKKTCDSTFEACAKQACGDDEKCSKDLELSNMMMKLSGCKRFDEAQYQSCECVINEKVTDKREAAIRNFYRKNSPENVDKAKSLVAKADTPSKLAGLFIKLLLKYPDAIIKKEDPMKAMFDKIKTEGAGKESEENANEEEVAEDEKIEL